MEKEVVYTNPPKKCDVCGTSIDRVFYDMKTVHGPWASMCPTCALLGPGIGDTGPGIGQRYQRRPDGKYAKTDG